MLRRRFPNLRETLLRAPFAGKKWIFQILAHRPIINESLINPHDSMGPPIHEMAAVAEKITQDGCKVLAR